LSAETGYECIEMVLDGTIARLSLNRPARRNAMNAQLLTELSDAFEVIRTDAKSRVVILRGAGSCFSAGYDLMPPDSSRPSRPDSVDDWDRLRRNMDRFFAIWDFPKPVIAAVHGYCLAGASQLCMFCDVTVVADDALVGVPSLPVGAGLLGPLWAMLVGPKRAKQLNLACGSRISGKTAADWGWANYAVPEADLFGNVDDLARRMSLMPPAALRIEKQAINQVLELAGLRTVAALAIGADVVAHESDFAGQIRQLIKGHGLREAIRLYEAGEWELAGA
jgi:enoyl-CoA hydratase